MITKKKGLYLGLLVSMLGVGNVMQAGKYTITIKNNTLHTVKYEIDIVMEWDKKGRIDPGHTAKVGLDDYGPPHQGSIRGVKAWVQRSGSSGVWTRSVWKRGGYKSQDRTFIISGDETGYTITEEVG